MQAAKSAARFDVATDATSTEVAGHAGSALLRELADRLGLTRRAGLLTQMRRGALEDCVITLLRKEERDAPS